MRILQILYGGLGGHGSVFFSMAEADTAHVMQNEALFVGIEELKPEYAERCKNNNIPFSFIKKKPGKHIAFFFRLFNAVRKADCDAVVVHGNVLVIPVWMALAVRRHKIKLITVMHQPIQLMSKKDWLGLRLSLKLADKTVFLTDEYKTIAEKILSRKLDKKTAVIPNGIDLSEYSPAKVKDKHEGVILGMQSRITSTKDHATLLDAFAVLKTKFPEESLKLKIAGDGELKTAMEEKARTMGIAEDVEFKGMLFENALPDFIRALDIYIHATLGETMSTAIMQVMACRKPIVASDIPGVNNMIRNGVTGLSVPPQNSEALANAVAHLIHQPEEAGQLATNAFQFALDNYSNTLMAKRYIAVFSGEEIN